MQGNLYCELTDWIYCGEQMEHFDVLAARMGTATTWAKAIEPPSATLPQWPFLAKHLGGGGVGWVGWVGVVFSLTWSVKVWQSSQRGTGWWKHDFKSEFFQHSHHRQRVYKGGKSHARLLWMLYGNKVILFSTRITECHRTPLILVALAVWFRKKNPRAVWNARLLGTRVRKHPACHER